MSFNMSSDEEFYDAEESTPNRIRSGTSESGPGVQQVIPTVEEEEQRLLELKQIAEERRKKEDEELQKQLVELEQRKKQEQERLEAEQRAHEGEMRRRRLEEMRRKLAEDQTPPSKPPQKPPRLHALKNNHTPQISTKFEEAPGEPVDGDDSTSTSASVTPIPLSVVVNSTPTSAAVNPTPTSAVVNPTPTSAAVNPTPISTVVNPTPASANVDPIPVSAVVNPTPVSTDVDSSTNKISNVDTDSQDEADRGEVVAALYRSENPAVADDQTSQRSDMSSLIEDSLSVDTQSTGQTIIEVQRNAEDVEMQEDMASPGQPATPVPSVSTHDVQDKIEISFKYDNETESVIAEVTENVTNSKIEYITDSTINVNITKQESSQTSTSTFNGGDSILGQGDNSAKKNTDTNEYRSSVTSTSSEPDTIQMAKTPSDASLNSQNSVVLPQSPTRQPVAPPRRKKKSRAPLPPPSAAVTATRAVSNEHSPSPERDDSNRESSPEQSTKALKVKTPNPGSLEILTYSENDADPIGLPMSEPETLSPVSTVFNLTKELEKSLDIQSATSGDRHVTASEDEEMKLGSSGKSTPISSRNGTPEHTLQRPRSNSGRLLTDEEILQAVAVVNLDTGEAVPLNMAEDKLPRCVNPLSLHIMRRTKEYSSGTSLHTNKSDEEDGDLPNKKQEEDTQTVCEVKIPRRHKSKGIKMKRFLGKTLNKIKSVADEVLHGEDSSSDSDDSAEGRRMIKIKASSAHKGPYDFDLLVPVQDLSGAHHGAVWTMKFSHCGRLLATGGQDNIVRIWVLKDASSYFDDMRQKYSEAARVSPSPSQESLNSMNEASETASDHGECDETEQAMGGEEEEDDHAPFRRRPFCVYRSHTADILDLSWSKNYFILSSSMDKTVRLWHVSRKECLCSFQHIDFVTAIAFHPRDDRYFLSGSLDGKLRLWNIPDKKVAMWNEVTGTSKLITAANFCMNGRFAVVGTYDGRCIFYSTEQLKYYTQIHVRSTRGKNARGRKISGIEPMPGEDKVLVTSNDSRVRLYDLRDLTLTCKYKGYANNSSQIKASFNYNGKYLISGSEDHFVYIWHTQHEFHKLSSARRDRNDFWEGIKAHSAVVTSAIFTPNPGLLIKPQFEFVDSQKKETPAVRGEVFISADFQGCIKVFLNKFKPGSGYM